MDRRADQEGGFGGVEAQSPEQDRVADHGKRRQQRDAGDHQQRIGLAAFAFRQDAGDGQRGRGAADRDRPARQQPERRAPPEEVGQPHACAQRQQDQRHDGQHRQPSQHGHVLHAQPQAHQRHAPAQQRLRREADARRAARLIGGGMQRHADQEREQHHRRAVAFGEKAGGGADHRGQHQPQPERAPVGQARGPCQSRHARGHHCATSARS